MGHLSVIDDTEFFSTNLSLINNPENLCTNLRNYCMGDLSNKVGLHNLIPVHVVAIPYPAQGHTVPLMQLCKQLASLGGFNITFVNTEHIHTRMLQAASHSLDDVPHGNPPLSVSDGNIKLVSIPGGLPPELHSEPAHIIAALQASEALSSSFDELLQKLNVDGPPVTHIISDAMLSWTQASADKLGIPRLAFWTSSAAVFYIIWHMYQLVMLNNLPSFKAALQEGINKTENTISWIPGLPPVDINDLPCILQRDPSDFVYQFMIRQLQPLPRAACILMNTFHDLESDVLLALQRMTLTPPILAIGPLLPPSLIDALGMTNSKHTSSPSDENGKVSVGVSELTKMACKNGNHAAAAATVKMRSCMPVLKHLNPNAIWRAPNTDSITSATYACRSTRSRHPRATETCSCLGGSIFGEDAGCLQWLNDQAPGSVLYISFGSLYQMAEAQFRELASGVEASGATFLWSIRPDFVEGGSYADKLPPAFLERTKERGLMMPWVPQLEVLSHPSIAGFLTHCGWNSMLESVCMGVPLLCWPDAGERRTNGLLAIKMWHTGLDFTLPKGSLSGHLISSFEVARVIKLLMSCQSFVHSNVAKLRQSALLSFRQGGSSAVAFELLLSHMSQHMIEADLEHKEHVLRNSLK